MTRKVADCRDYPSDIGCTLTIAAKRMKSSPPLFSTPCPPTVTKTVLKSGPGYEKTSRTSYPRAPNRGVPSVRCAANDLL